MLDFDKSDLWFLVLISHSLPFNLCKRPCPRGPGRRPHWLTCWPGRRHLPAFISLICSVAFDTVGYLLLLDICSLTCWLIFCSGSLLLLLDSPDGYVLIFPYFQYCCHWRSTLGSTLLSFCILSSGHLFQSSFSLVPGTWGKINAYVKWLFSIFPSKSISFHLF